MARTPRPNTTSISVVITNEEKAALDAQAAARNMATGTFCRIVMAGAAKKGGGTLDQLIAMGEAVIGDPNVGKRRRPGRAYAGLWQIANPERKTEGLLVFKQDPKWRLQNPRPWGVSATSVDTTQRDKWWYLYHQDSPWKRYPMAFRKQDACEQATMYIEGIESEAQAVAALTQQPPESSHP